MQCLSPQNLNIEFPGLPKNSILKFPGRLNISFFESPKSQYWAFRGAPIIQYWDSREGSKLQCLNLQKLNIEISGPPGGSENAMFETTKISILRFRGKLKKSILVCKKSPTWQITKQIHFRNYKIHVFESRILQYFNDQKTGPLNNPLSPSFWALWGGSRAVLSGLGWPLGDLGHFPPVLPSPSHKVTTLPCRHCNLFR